ncbi:hypothetical protein ACLOJK_032961 [Asimina triloba]
MCRLIRQLCLKFVCYFVFTGVSAERVRCLRRDEEPRFCFRLEGFGGLPKASASRTAGTRRHRPNPVIEMADQSSRRTVRFEGRDRAFGYHSDKGWAIFSSDLFYFRWIRSDALVGWLCAKGSLFLTLWSRKSHPSCALCSTRPLVVALCTWSRSLVRWLAARLHHVLKIFIFGKSLPLELDGTYVGLAASQINVTDIVLVGACDLGLFVFGPSNYPNFLELIYRFRGSHGSDNSLGQVASSPPFFCGSPPSRAPNPLVHDARFGDEKLTPLTSAPPTSAGKSSSPSTTSSSSARKGCVRTKFGLAPAAVRIEGFDCLDRDRRSCRISAVA